MASSNSKQTLDLSSGESSPVAGTPEVQHAVLPRTKFEITHQGSTVFKTFLVSNDTRSRQPSGKDGAGGVDRDIDLEEEGSESSASGRASSGRMLGRSSFGKMLAKKVEKEVRGGAAAADVGGQG